MLWFWVSRYSGPSRLNFVVFKVNGETIKILPGESISLHPSDRVMISWISTNIPLSFGVRPFADRVDIAALFDSEAALSEILPDREIYEHYSFHIDIKHKNKTIGSFDLTVRPYVEDWLERANRMINSDQRILFLEKASALLPSEKDITERLMLEYKAKGYLQKAIHVMERLAAEKETKERLWELAELFKNAGNMDRLALTLERLLKLVPGDAMARLNLAETFEKAEMWDKAAGQYETLLIATPEEERATLLKRLGYAFLRAGKFEKAVSSFLSAARWDQKDVNLYYNLAYLYDKLGDEDKSAFYLRNALTLNPDDSEGRLSLAERFLSAGECERAEKLVQEVLEKTPDSRQALMMLAKAFEGLKEKERLLNVYRKLLDIDSNDEVALFNLAALEYEMGRLDDALSHLERYEALHPRDESVHKIIFEIYKRKNDNGSAAREAELLISINPSYIAPYSFLFGHLLDKGLYDEILRVMRTGAAANPDAQEILEYLLDAYVRTGQELQAMDTMEAILKISSKSTAFIMRLASLREKHGQFAKAMDLYGRVIEIDPQNREAESAYLRLRLKGIGVEGE